VSPGRQVDFEYGIKKDVRNNAIVREIDEERHRQLWRSVGIGGMVVVVLLFSIWLVVDRVAHGYQIQKLELERAAEEEKNEHLRMEIEVLRAPSRIEEMALRDLKLVHPDQDKAIVIERVTSPAAPEPSIVAAR